MNSVYFFPKLRRKRWLSKKKWLGMLVMSLVFGMTVLGCFSLGTPKSFQKGSGGDTTILLREGLDYQQAFREVDFAIRKHRFEVETITPEVGYLRTQWNYTWNDTGKTIEAYRVRIICNFNPSRTQLIVKAEAEYLERGQWVQGFDTRALSTLRTDLTSVVGN